MGVALVASEMQKCADGRPARLIGSERKEAFVEMKEEKKRRRFEKSRASTRRV